MLQSNVYRGSHKGLHGLLSFFPSKPYILPCRFFAKPVREKCFVSFHVLGRFGTHGGFAFMRVMLFRYFHSRWNEPIRNMKSSTQYMVPIRQFQQSLQYICSTRCEDLFRCRKKNEILAKNANVTKTWSG